jgi:hypothetical protein
VSVKLIKPAKNRVNALELKPHTPTENKDRDRAAKKNLFCKMYFKRRLNSRLLLKLKLKLLVNGIPSGKKAMIARTGTIINH